MIKFSKKILPYIHSGEIRLQEYNRLPEKNENGEVELDSEEIDLRYINCLLTDAFDYEYYTLFDSSLFDTVDRAVRELTVLHNKGKYKHAGFVKEVIPTLPDFDRAGLDEIVDIKRELKEPLERFRREVYSFVDKINFLPWEKDFKEECKSIYMTTMKDSVDEIRELTKTTSILKNIATESGRSQCAGVVRRHNGKRSCGRLLGDCSIAVCGREGRKRDC